MGKATGFLEYTRKTAGLRPVEVRIKDYDEIHLPQAGDELHRQAARCMDCGVPFCHAGFEVQGGSIGCPLCNLIPEVNDLVYRGDDAGAFARLSKTHPFPEITGRVCPALCEGSCTLGQLEPAVTIKDIERHVVDAAFANGLVTPRIPKLRLGRKVAVVGSGPAGLACADLLNQLGNVVTVFERADRPGGMLMYGIPGMKLEKGIVLRRAQLLQQEGVELVLNCEIGADYPVLRLMQEYDAIVLCTGSTKERVLTAPGSGLAGVFTAMQYLTASTRAQLGDAPLPPGMDACGLHTVVLGGGDTGADCVATALRQGAKSITQLEILPKAPAQRAENNPWPLWPRTARESYAAQEAAHLYGGDATRYTTTIKEAHAGAGGTLESVTTIQVEWQCQNGKTVPVELPGTEQTIPAQLLVTAMGFTGPQQELCRQLGLATGQGGVVQTKAGSHKSSLPRVFAAGDVHRGPSLVVWALAEGRRAALECHESLAR